MEQGLIILFFLVTFVFSSESFDCGGRVFRSGVSIQERNFIVNKHNELRVLLANGKIPRQPRAVNSRPLSWDDQLAYEAQRIANTCKFEHQDVIDTRFAVGQNLFKIKTSKYADDPNWNLAIEYWFDEQQFYNYHIPANSISGHNTEIAWYHTRYVGCGYINYEGLEVMPNLQLYVCNYGPSENDVSLAPYETGRSRCEKLC